MQRFRLLLGQCGLLRFRLFLGQCGLLRFFNLTDTRHIIQSKERDKKNFILPGHEILVELKQVLMICLLDQTSDNVKKHGVHLRLLKWKCCEKCKVQLVASHLVILYFAAHSTAQYFTLYPIGRILLLTKYRTVHYIHCV